MVNQGTMVKSVQALVLAAMLVLTPGSARCAGSRIYPDPEQAQADIAAALRDAAATHRRILLDFGADWCGDCKVLDVYLNDGTNKPLIDAGFVVVHVNVARFNANLDLAEKYEIPLKRGVPALAVLSEHGELLYSQRHGEFESMRSMASSSVSDFLEHWRPHRPGTQ